MKGSLKFLGLITQIGITVVITVLITTTIGVYLDRRFKTNAIFTLVFIVIGSVSGIWSAYKLIQEISSDDLER
ncbi:MAG: AtpZ/AtpI family protein [Firmicutes bacterium]|nr:AtpZ/AtpI family protein [Bacillota bacterium]